MSEWSYDRDRDRVMAHRNGAAQHTVGGADGDDYLVTSLSDSGKEPGTLRRAAESSEPLWIRFAVDGVIQNLSTLKVRGPKTIDGYHARVALSGRRTVITGPDVAMMNLTVGPVAGKDSDDGLSIQGATRVWLRHMTVHHTPDGLVDATNPTGPMSITLERCYLGPQEGEGKAALFNGNRDDPSLLEVTVHHSVFADTYQRNPRIVYGWCHAYSNLVLRFGGVDGRGYGMQAGAAGRLLAEGNIFDPHRPGGRIASGLRVDRPCLRAIVGTRSPDAPPAAIRAMGNHAPGCLVETVNPELVELPSYPYQVEPADLSLADSLLKHQAGVQPHVPF